jgi:hypothetical protein
MLGSPALAEEACFLRVARSLATVRSERDADSFEAFPRNGASRPPFLNRHPAHGISLRPACGVSSRSRASPMFRRAHPRRRASQHVRSLGAPSEGALPRRERGVGPRRADHPRLDATTRARRSGRAHSQAASAESSCSSRLARLGSRRDTQDIARAKSRR